MDLGLYSRSDHHRPAIEVAVDRRRVHPRMLGVGSGSQYHGREGDRRTGGTLPPPRRAEAHPQRQRTRVHRQRDRRWLSHAGVEALYVEPGSPWENGYAESFHSRLRDELTNREEFANLAEAKHLADAWRLEYNHRRPHSSLGYQTPAEFAAGCAAASVRPTASLQQQHSRNPRCLPLPVT